MISLVSFPTPLLGFAAYSGTGKTTLLEKLIPLLVAQGLKIALVKHSHHDIEMDTPGKDSYRLRKAGASQVVLAGTHRSICFHEHEQAHDSDVSFTVTSVVLTPFDLESFSNAEFRDSSIPGLVPLMLNPPGTDALHHRYVLLRCISDDLTAEQASSRSVAFPRMCWKNANTRDTLTSSAKQEMPIPPRSGAPNRRLLGKLLGRCASRLR